MIEARLSELNKQAILYYLSWSGQGLDDYVRLQMDRCIQTVLDQSMPKLSYRIFTKEEIKSLSFRGKDVEKLSDDCEFFVLFGATIGNGIERLLLQKEVSNMADALIMDACASCAIENVCDNFEMDLRTAYKKQGLYVSSRYSPGYGDFPLESQIQFFDVLDLNRHLGLTLSDSYIMTPRKSVTALMAISKKPYVLRKNGCEQCNLFMQCAYRKEGKTCE